MNVYNMELQEFAIVFGNGILLPWVQTLLNKYVPKEYRSICVFGLSILAGVAWTLVYSGGLEGLLTNTALIMATSQTVYFKVLKETPKKKK